jgi:YidC/Oxa1 family membrane protein insertase
MLAVELRGAHFAFWINDLSAPEKLQLFGMNVPLLVVLFVVAMAVQQWTTPSTMEPAQKKVMMVMPIFMGFLFAGFPAGLTLYMLTNMLISIGQQKGMYRSEKGTSAFKITSMVCLAVFVVAFSLATIGG